VLAGDTALAAVPDGLDLTAAATVPMTGLTARLILDTLALGPGQSLAVTGAAGAVGGFVVELAAREGLQVVAIAAAEDERLVRDLGASGFVPRGPGAAAALAGGVDALVDAAVLGAEVLPAVRDGGRIVSLRPFAGEPERGIGVELVSVRAYLHEQTKLADLLELAAAGDLHVRVAETYPPERAGEAHARLDAGGLRGRPVLVF
jgi:NADPH:quinone reductase-like Zn-dependent oxidoreductase